jgi:hypothetical protein
MNLLKVFKRFARFFPGQHPDSQNVAAHEQQNPSPDTHDSDLANRDRFHEVGGWEGMSEMPPRFRDM